MLALDDVDCDSFSGELDGVGVRSWRGANRRLLRSAMQPGTDAGWRARPTPWSGRAGCRPTIRPAAASEHQARLELNPRPAVRAVLAAVVTFPVSTTSAPGRGQSQSVPAASLMRNPSRHSITITPRSLSPSGSSPAARMTRNDLLDGGRIRRVPKALVGWRKAPVETCEVCRRAAPARCDPVRIPCRPPLDDDRYGVTVLLSRRLHQKLLGPSRP